MVAPLLVVGCDDDETTKASCDDGQLTCAGACVNPMADAHHCGSCGTTCPEGEKCQQGDCVVTCAETFTQCPPEAPTYCADLMTDDANCGTCGHACLTGDKCEQGDCVPDCVSPTTQCPPETPTYCADLMTDDANCGTCGQACLTGDTCEQGDCLPDCVLPTTQCPPEAPTYCADLMTDDANCGTCGQVCLASERCELGDCLPDCATPTTQCPPDAPTYCADLMTDDANCGTCGHPCLGGQQCVAGSCVCAGLTPDTCGSGDSAYCTNFRRDSDNCDGCDQPCTGGLSCHAGRCVNATVNVTVLHTNDFHGSLQLAGSNPGIARTAAVINSVRTAVGAANTALLDSGDMLQGTLLSNLYHGSSTIDAYNAVGYAAATLGNHEFDWGQATLAERAAQADFPFLAANVVLNDTGNCATAGWNSPAFVEPWTVIDVGSGANWLAVGVIGVTTVETPIISLASSTQGLCFKDPVEAIDRHYAAMQAAGADVVVVLSHLGNTDGGYGYGIPVYGDQTLARELYAHDLPVHLIVGGHSHTDLAAAQVIDGIPVVQAHYASRKVGRADFAVDWSTGAVTVTWQRLTVSTTGTEDPAVKTLVDGFASTVDYQNQLNRVVGYTNVDLVRNYNGDSLMGAFITDAIYQDLNTDGTTANDADMVFFNPGSLRADITSASKPYAIKYGELFNVLPFGQATVVADMTGADIAALLDQSATLFKGALQLSHARYQFYRYSDTLPGPQPWAWGAYDIEVWDKTDGAFVPLEPGRTYRIATTDFLAPAGQDGFTAFKYARNLNYWGDTLEGVMRWLPQAYPVEGSAYAGALDGRITRVGDDTYDTDPVIPLTILHHNDAHGRLAKIGAAASYTQLATVIKQERAHNPTRTLLLQSGDAVQGDAMMSYYRSAAVHPAIAAMNEMDYDAYTLGEHDFDFGRDAFRAATASLFYQATFPLLLANVTDDGSFGLADAAVTAHERVERVGPSGNIKVAVLGLGSSSLARVHLPSQRAGLTIGDPVAAAVARTPALRASNDVVVALTHLGFAAGSGVVELTPDHDQALAATVAGLDVILGGHSHTDPSRQTAGSGGATSLPQLVAGPGSAPVLVSQAWSFNRALGEVVIGLVQKAGGGYRVVSRVGRYLSVTSSTPEDADIKALVDPYLASLTPWLQTSLGQTTIPVDGADARIAETNSLDLQVDAARWKVEQTIGRSVDFHLGGAGSTATVAASAAPGGAVALTHSDAFALVPHEDSLVVFTMTGVELRQVLERAYRNYYGAKYVTGGWGYLSSPACLLGISDGGEIVYHDTYPALPDGNNVISLTANGHVVDLTDDGTTYEVSTLSSLAAGACNFNDDGVSVWPLTQISADTAVRARDALVDYLKAQAQPIAPTIAGRLVWQ